MDRLKMKKFVIFSLIFLFLPSILWAKKPTPCIEASPLSFDFGKIKEGPVYKTKFEVDNCGDAPLHIVHIRTSCGCTGAVIGKNILNPSESTEVLVTFHSAGISGPFRKYISIQSNDPTCPNLLLEIKGITIPQPGPHLVLEPWKIHILKRVKDKIYIRAKLENKGSKPLVITKIIGLHYNINLLSNRDIIIAPHKTKILRLSFKKPPFVIRKIVFLIYSNDPNQPIHYLLVLPKVEKNYKQNEIVGCPACNEQREINF